MDRQYIKDRLKDKKLLLVDDDELILESLERLFGRYFEDVRTASRGDEGLKHYIEDRADIVISDITMPYMSGVEMAQQIYATDPDIKIIFLTGHNEEEYIKEIDIFGWSYMLKPISKKEILRKIVDIV